MRLSRPCYDKPHRCPGWAGGGMRYPKVDRCDGGRITVAPSLSEVLAAEETWDGHPIANPRRLGRCTECDVVTIPWAWTYLDPSRLDLRRRLRRLLATARLAAREMRR